MAVSESYRTFVLERLEVVGEITARNMFGGVGIYCNGFFFALLADDALYLKVDDSNRADFESYGMGPFAPFEDKGDSRVMQYYEVPADVLEDNTLLRVWGRKALQVAQSSRQSSGKFSKGRKKNNARE
jgi:DNA transformation protein and related proteins